MSGSRLLQPGVLDDGTVWASCECEGRYVLVPVEEIRAGRTGRCSDRCRMGGVRIAANKGTKHKPHRNQPMPPRRPRTRSTA